MAFVNIHVLRWKSFYFLFLILFLSIYTEHRNDRNKLCLTPVEFLQLVAEWMHSSYCNDTGVLLKRLGLIKCILSEMLNLLYHLHLYPTAYYVLPNEPSGKQNHLKNEIFAYSLSACRHLFHLLLLTQLVFVPIHGTHEIVFSHFFNHRFFCHFEIMWVVDQETQNRICRFKFWLTRRYKQGLF